MILTGRLVVVHIDALQLQIAVAVVVALAIDAVLIGDDLPELETTNELFIVTTSQAAVALIERFG